MRQFAIDLEIPYSTLVTALERGIEGMAYGTVIKMCDKLSDHAKQSMLIIQKKNKFCGITQMRFRWNPLNG